MEEWKRYKEIEDLIAMVQERGADAGLLLRDAYNRGFMSGKEFAKKKAIEAIEQEK